MTNDFWDERAELVQAAICGKNWGGRRAPAQVMKATLGQIAAHLRHQDLEEIWRFTVITDTGRHIRSAELRALLQRCDIPS